MTTKPLPERLRAGIDISSWRVRDDPQIMLNEAAARIEALEAQVAGMRKALEPVQEIYCAEPGSASRLDVFERGCPLTPPQIRAMQAALRSTVPADVVCVPREPTEAMIDAGWIDKEDVSPKEIWYAICAAALSGGR